jgi:hypothetical protein
MVARGRGQSLNEFPTPHDAGQDAAIIKQAQEIANAGKDLPVLLPFKVSPGFKILS